MDLPFERYEHRCLAARDILVLRIMSKLLFPGSKGLARVYDNEQDPENSLRPFGTIREHDRVLARDLELLRKMLATCSVNEALCDGYAKLSKKMPASNPLHHVDGTQRQFLSSATVICMPVHGDTDVYPTVGDEILDLVRRHYFETDNPSTRLWLQATQPPVPSSYNTLPSQPSTKTTRAAWVQQRMNVDRANDNFDEKKWYPEDSEHLRSFQIHARTQHSLKLYDGGTLLPPLRQPLLETRSSRMKYHSIKTEIGDHIPWVSEWQWGVIKHVLHPWPGENAPRQVILGPTGYEWSPKERWFRAMQHMVPVDFASGRTGRGMDRDGIWSTGRWVHDGEDRGRPGKRGRRRACSEPPPGMFTTAQLPWSFHHPREMLIFTKMNLSTADRRSRRRSLSRTRIAEMFDWDTMVTAQPARGNLQFKDKRPPVGQPATSLSPCVHKIEQRFERSRLRRGEKRQPCDANDLRDDLVTTLPGNRLPLMPCCRGTGPGSCTNCTSMGHTASRCATPCGYCGAPSPKTLYPALKKKWAMTPFGEGGKLTAGEHGNLHMASSCPVEKQNRCKCGPFPQYHVSGKCPVLCSRRCGNDYPPGHFKHKNAMTCKARCCMCGAKGHSGQQCKLKRCRCGGAHLGQDCRWKVECRVMGCNNFLCGLHCVGCGMSRGELQEGQGFSGGMCPSCLSETRGGIADDSMVDGGHKDDQEGAMAHRVADDTHAQHPTSKKTRRKPIRKRRGMEKKKKETQELPWYAPLQPRVRPIVTSKSGKRVTGRT